MQGVHDVVIARYGVRGSLVHILGPVRGAHQDDAVRILFPDNRDDLFGIGLYVVP